MAKKTPIIDLTKLENYELIKRRLLEVSLYDWVNRAIGLGNKSAVKCLIGAYVPRKKTSHDNPEDYAKTQSIIDSIWHWFNNSDIEPNQLEYAMLYNQLGNVTQKEAFKVIKANTTSPIHPNYSGMYFKQPTLSDDLYKEIRKILLKVESISFDYQQIDHLKIN